MELKLFSKECIHTDLAYEDNLKLRPFSESFFSKETTELLLDMFSLYGDNSEISGRQELFKEITENTESRKFLKKIRASYKNVENAVILYERAVSKQEKDIWGVNLLKQYVAFIKEVSLGEPVLHSQKLKRLYNSLTEIRNSQEFCNLCNVLAETEKVFSKVREMNVYGNYVSTTLMYHGLNPGRKKNIRQETEEYLADMDISVETKDILQVRDIDLYVKYVSYIISEFPEVGSSFFALNRDFINTIQDIADSDIKDILMALACCDLYDLLKEKGVSLCYPEISDKDEMMLQGMADISLLMQKDNIVSNGIKLSESDRASFVSGANGGGKTSFIRAIGICNLMCSCGLFVPAKSAVLPVRDNIFTVFPHKEQLSIEGRFVTEKSFLQSAVEKATCKSLVLANELFSTTDENTALKQYEYFTEIIVCKNVRAIYVTHFTNVINLFGDKGYPLYSCKMHGNQVTYEVERSGEHSSSVALLLKKYRLQKSQLKERLTENA